MKPVAIAALVLSPALLSGQTAERPTLDFSGVAFGNFQVRTDSAAKFSAGGEPASRFDIARAYLTFRMPAGDRANIRITTDIFQNTTDGYYGGWAVRLKYAILQYELSKNLAGVQGLGAVARIGMLQNVVIDHMETFWPRWMGTTPVDRTGFFSSSDVGASSLLTLPGRTGEVYLTVTNGPGYQSAENDRFKDVAARFSWTPFAGDSGIARTLTITPWYYKGWRASQFVTGGGAQVGPVSDGLQRDRRGLFVGLRDRRITLGAEYSQRLEDVEGGANTVASPRTVRDRTSDLVAAFAVLRPAELIDPARRSRLSLIGRLERYTPDTDLDAADRFTVLGAIWDLNSRISLALDYQGLSPKNGSPTVPVKSWFLHWVANF